MGLVLGGLGGGAGESGIGEGGEGNQFELHTTAKNSVFNIW